MRASNVASTWVQSAARPLLNWATRCSTSAIRSRSSLISWCGAQRAAALHLERVDHGGRVVDERLFLHVAPDDELVGQAPAEGWDVDDPALVDVGRRVDAPGAQNGAAGRADVGELGSLDAEACQVTRLAVQPRAQLPRTLSVTLSRGGKRVQVPLSAEQVVSRDCSIARPVVTYGGKLRDSCRTQTELFSVYQWLGGRIQFSPCDATGLNATRPSRHRETCGRAR